MAWNQGELEGTVTEDYNGGSSKDFAFRETEVNLAWGLALGGGYRFDNRMAARMGFKYFDAGEVANLDVEGVNLYFGFDYGF